MTATQSVVTRLGQRGFASGALPQSGPSWRTRLLPILVIECYLTVSILGFALGPWEYPPYNATRLYWFVAGSHVLLLLGYLSAVFKAPAGPRWRPSPQRLSLLASVCTLALFLPTSYFRTGNVIPNVLAGLSNPGLAYNIAYSVRAETSPAAEYARISVGPIMALCLPILVAYWTRLSRTARIIGVAAVGSNVALFIAMGTNKALADTFLLIPAMILLRYLGNDLRIRWLKKVFYLTVFLTAAFLLFQFFSEGMATRAGSAAHYGYIARAHARANYDHPALNIGGDFVRVGILGVTAYISGGYYALALSLDQPFVPMYGVGNSAFLTRQAARLLDDDSLLYRSYPQRVQSQTGWDAYGLWATIYPWIASDVSFIGTLGIVFLIGRLFAQSWLDSLTFRNPFAIAMLAQFVIMLFYFNANNQCLQDGEGVSAFWGLMLAWRCSRVTLRFSKRSLAWRG